MAESHSLEDEYKYFHTFVKNTNQKFSHDDNLNFLQLQSYTLELIEETMPDEKESQFRPDKDNIKFQCAHIIGLLFSICQGKCLRFIYPCLPSRYLHERYPKTVINEFATNKRLVKANRTMDTSYAKLMEYHFDKSQEMVLQDAIYEYSALIWRISNMPSIHDLLSLKIQLYCHPHILTERYHSKISKPFMTQMYNNWEISKTTLDPGWKYYWNPRSTILSNLLNASENSTIKYGSPYTIEELTETLRETILTKLYNGKSNEKDLISSLSQYFQLQSDEIDIRDRNTFIWPVLQHTYCLSFEDIFNSKYLPNFDEIRKNVKIPEIPEREQKFSSETQKQGTNKTPVENATQTSQQPEIAVIAPTQAVPIPTLSTPKNQTTNPSGYTTVINLHLDPETIDLTDMDLTNLGFNVITQDGPHF